jgi:RNA polymerase primary sigma factor
MALRSCAPSQVTVDGVEPTYTAQSQEPLLTAEEEKELITAYHEGLRAARRLREGVPAKLQPELERLVVTGNEALDILIRRNQRLVYNIALRFADFGSPMQDLIQDGNEGLLRALQRFDPSKGFKLSTYCTYWIRRHIISSSKAAQSMLRISGYGIALKERTDKAHQQLTQTLGREPTMAEVIDMLGYSNPDLVQNVHLRTLSFGELRLEDDATLDEILVDTNNLNPEDESEQTELRQLVRETIEQLPDKERDVIRNIFGIQRPGEKTISEVAAEMNLSPSHVRHVLDSALSRLRRTKALRQYLGKNDSEVDKNDGRRPALNRSTCSATLTTLIHRTLLSEGPMSIEQLYQRLELHPKVIYTPGWKDEISALLAKKSWMFVEQTPGVWGIRKAHAKDSGSWADLIEWALKQLGGSGSTGAICSMLEGHYKTKTNRNWKPTVRCVLQRRSGRFYRCSDGQWRLVGAEGSWGDLAEWALKHLGGSGSTRAICSTLEGHYRTKTNRNWKSTIRCVLQRRNRRFGRRYDGNWVILTSRTS